MSEPTPTKALLFPGELFLVQGHAAFLIPPKVKAGDGPTPWVWYAPTLPPYPGDAEAWMFERFLGAGIAIAGIDVGESFGSPTGRKLFTALHQELTTRHRLANQACLLASRARLMLYNWAAEHPRCVAGVAGIYPVCDLRSYPGLGKACGAYGLTEAQLAAQLEQHNPIDRLEGLAKADVPIFHIHGDIDALVPLDKNSGALAERYRTLGGRITLKIATGQGHTMWPGFFECRELVDFVVDCVQPAARG